MKYRKFHNTFHESFTLAIAESSHKVANIYYKLFLKCAQRMNRSLSLETRLNLYFQLSDYMANMAAKKLSHVLLSDLKRINRGRKAIFCARVNTSLDIQFQKVLTTSTSDIKRMLDMHVSCQGCSAAKLSIYHNYLNNANLAFEKVYAKARGDLYAFIAGNLNAIIMMLDESSHEIRNVLGRFLFYPVELKHGISATDEADSGFFPRRYCRSFLAVLESSIIGEDTFETVNSKLIEYIERRLDDKTIGKESIAHIYKTTDISEKIMKYVEKVYERFEGQQRRLDFVAAVNEHLKRNGPPGPEFTYAHLQLVLAAWYDFSRTGMKEPECQG